MWDLPTLVQKTAHAFSGHDEWDVIRRSCLQSRWDAPGHRQRRWYGQGLGCDIGKELLSLGHPERVWGIAYSSDGSRLATASWDQTARMWDVTPSQEVLTLSGGPGSRGGMAFSPKGTHLAVTSSFSPAKVWDVSTGQEVLTLSGAHNAPVSAVAFSPEGTRWPRLA